MNPRGALIFAVLVGSAMISGCSGYEDTVIQDTSTSKNKRIARIESLKSSKPKLKSGVQKPIP